MIKAIIFDCFGVLTADAWREFVDSLPPEADTDRARELNHQYDAGLLSLKDFLEQVKAVTGREPYEVERLLDNESEATKNKPLLAYIAKLKNDGYKIGLLSNIGTDWITNSFLTKDEQSLFDEMILSYKVGTTKPDHKIYEIACERLDVKPHETIFTDDVKEYCDAASSVGLHGIHYTGFSQLKTDITSLLTQE